MALSEKQIARLAADAKAFDEQVVLGVVEFYNAIGPNHPGGNEGVDVAAISERAFGWVPPVMEHMAQRDGINPSVVKWNRAEDVGAQLKAHLAVAAFVRGGWLFNPFRAAMILKLDGQAHMDWLNRVLGALPVYGRYHWTGRDVRFTSLPCLTSVQSCVAYAVALIRLDRHGLGARVRACGFVADENKLNGQHLFMADDLRQKFCCPAHNNAQRQREFRRRQTKPRRAAR
ncbi:MAG: hypothetical protein R3E75_08200 [Steroidobacteraceae bacterium]|nr:hypothetical protein [Nevskiaceae bacterium]MCP5472285.1 hypothetical protein [Nevskiaceae bacterium]